MWRTDSHHIDCPYCGERIEIVVDLSVDEQCYIEDCSVCCRPIVLTTIVDMDGEANVVAAHEDD